MDKNLSSWSPKEMGSVGLARINTRLRVVDVSSDSARGKPLPCPFYLYYFFGAGFAPQDPRRKNILFIPGGPGEIVNPAIGRDLECLERFHNIVYFHVRGSGLSKLPASNKYDRFLRADYVVEDIERIRRHIFQNERPWDAIVGISHGALIAQHFAYRFGGNGVKKLILAAPPARSRDTLGVRRRVTVSNLRAIYKLYRSRQRTKRTDEAILSVILNNIDVFEKANAKGGNKEQREKAKEEREKVMVEFTNDFGFIRTQRVGSLCQRLSTLLNALERRYYSISFVVENYKHLVKNDDSFKDYPYPYELFVAIKQLQMLGRPLPRIAFSELAKRKQVNAALTIAYYLTLPRKQLKFTRNGRVPFQKAAPLMRELAEITRNCYFERLEIARKDLLTPSGKSYRSYYVFGIHDGISRWILEIMKQRINRDGFFRGKAIQDLGNRQPVEDEELVASQLAKNIGVIPTEPIFPWYPGEYRHNVPSLVLWGAADAITAGLQAEDFFKDGVMNKARSVLLEFPGAGHTILALPGTGKISGEAALENVIRKFLSKHSPSAFLRDPKVKKTLRAYGAVVH
jgi:pimeloyl-ACP methyl ester carboxylesterase